MIVELWCDGSGTRSGPIGWAYVLRARTFAGELLAEKTGGGFACEGTNNRAELMALLDGLRALTAASKLTVFTDSEYVLKGFTEHLDGWIARDWRKAAGGAVANADLWAAIARQAAEHELTFEFVPGHQGISLNERCDRLAGAARRLVKAELAPEVSAA